MNVLTKLVKVLKNSTNKNYPSIEIISANPLSTDDFNNILNCFNNDIVITQKIDRNILNGLRLKYGDLEIDATFNKSISNLEELLNNEINESDNLLSEIQNKIDKFKSEVFIQEKGTVISVKDGVCFAIGLNGCMYQELVEFENGIKGIAMNIEKEKIGIVILGNSSKVSVGDSITRSKKVISVGVGDELIGRVVNSLGQPLDGKTELKFKKSYPIEKVAPGVITRAPVDKPLLTGIKAIDALVPIGRGQRELILGDRQVGKTSIAIDTIINQKGQDVICIYVAIGQKDSKIVRLVEKLNETNSMEYTIIVNASASSSAAMQYIAPYSATAIAEYFADMGKDVLIIYDDLSKHAVAYRELSLLLKRPPGREAYPGDVFYIHSRLLERSCNLSEEYGGGSITSLPIIETQAGDISAYIPTNVISITDGQIFLETDLFYKGIKPAINVGLSVSRVGSAAQTKSMKKVAGKLKLSLAQYRELEAFSQFSSDLDQQTKDQLERGKKTIELLKQENFKPISNADNVISIFALNNGLFDSANTSDVSKLNGQFIEYVLSTSNNIYTDLEQGTWTEEIEKTLTQLISEFKNLQ